MSFTTTAEIVAADIALLLRRIFDGKTITYFGADGLGKYGRSDYPQTSFVNEFDLTLRCDDADDPQVFDCKVKLLLSGYDAKVTGHVMTDKNFRIGLDQLCTAEAVDPAAFDWADLSDQEDDKVCLKVDVQLLLAW